MLHKRLMFVFGTRPEAIKVAPVILEAEKHSDFLGSVVVVTGQHRQMLDQVLKIFKINPDYDLDIMQEAQSLTTIAIKCLEGLEDIIVRERPDILLVQGDTTSAFIAALAAFYHHIPVAHIEAGLRTFDKFRPYPEEMNRKLVSSIADLHFAPTRTSVNNLLAEKIPAQDIFLTGNTVIDALLSVAKKDFDLKKVNINVPKNKKLILVTLHRRESFGRPLHNMCNAIKKIAEKYSNEIHIIIPVHKNPQVQEMVRGILGEASNIELIDPIDYEPFVHLMKSAYIILTDSGGIQEEAPSLGKPVLVLREKTERPEAIAAGMVKLIGVEEKNIIRETEFLLKDEKEYIRMSKSINPYGDGRAAERIMGALLHSFGFTDRRPEEFLAA